ncbi:MAG: pitrilysin family protein [Armatimonadota bacterium]|nr:pitrilysin family protein [Armatimonadota bacterium]
MNRRRWALVGAALGVALLVQVAVAAPIVETLDNGCRLIVEVDRSRPVAAFRIYVGAGSIYEGRWLGAGISHFVEHTISKGSESRSRAEIEVALDELGNTYNAYTTKDHTCYYITTAGDLIADAIDAVSDFVLHPTFPEEEVETQRGIILREMAMGEDQPARRIHHLMTMTMFTTHPYRYRIIGYPEVFEELTREDLATFHRQLCVPSNMVAVAVGDFDGEEVLAQLRDIFASMPRQPKPATELASEPQQIAPRRRVVEDEAVQRAYLRIAWHTIDIFHPDLYALDTLSYYLTGGESSVLVRKLRDELGLVDSIGSYSATPAYDAGHFVFTAVLDPANLERVEEEILAELKAARRHPPAGRELERVKRQVQASEVYAQETAEGRASALGRDLMVTGDVEFSRKYVEGILAVRPREVAQVARKYFDPERMTVAVLRPPEDEEEEEVRPERAGRPRTHLRQLDNGLTVVVRENHAIPVVSIVTATLGGLRYETDETAGVTALMAQMLVRGTQTRTRQEIAERVDRLGGSLEPYSGRNSFGLTAHFLSGDLPAAAELTVDALFHPTFPTDELERQKQLTLAAIQSRKDNVEAWAYSKVLEELFTLHPYRYMPNGTEESVSALTAEDLRRFHKAYARPSATAVVIAGDVQPEEAFAQIERLAGGLTGELQEPPSVPGEPPIQQPRTEVIERPQQQAIVAYGFHGITVDDPRREILDVLDAVISGSGMPGGRLHEALRGQQLVYFVHGVPLLGLDPGAFIIYAGTRPESVQTVRGEIERIVRSIAEEPPSDEELERAKQMAIAADRVSLQTNSALAQTIALDVIYGLGADNWEGYAERIEAVTAQQVQELASEILDLNRTAVVVTRPPAEQ